MKKITLSVLNKLSSEAEKSDRKRKNLNYHEELSDTLQRMLNAMEPGTYIQPHKHENPDKREAFILLKGKIVVITFDDTGKIIDSILLDTEAGNYGVEIPEKVWHAIIVLAKGSVIYEVKDGPYVPINDKNFASWAPKEGSPECAEYTRELLRLLHIDISQ